MYVIRETVSCRPGKVRPMVEKFRVISAAIEAKGLEPMRLMTDVSGARFWTLVAETEVERIEDFFTLEQELMADESVRAAMADYHELVLGGGREIYRLES